MSRSRPYSDEAKLGESDWGKFPASAVPGFPFRSITQVVYNTYYVHSHTKLSSCVWSRELIEPVQKNLSLLLYTSAVHRHHLTIDLFQKSENSEYYSMRNRACILLLL